MVGLTTALIASVTALVASAITYLSTSRRDRLQASLEVARYREKTLDKFRIQVAYLMSSYTSNIGRGVREAEFKKFIEHMNLVSILMSPHNPQREKIENIMAHMGSSFGGSADELRKSHNNLSKCYIDAAEFEWLQIEHALKGK